MSERPQIHAADAMGKAANDALLATTRLDFRLAIAASGNASREERADALKWAFRQYRVLVRAFSKLETIAPNSAAAGYAEDDKARDFIESREEKAS